MTISDVHAAIAKCREFAAAGQFAEARIVELELLIAFAVWTKGQPNAPDWVARKVIAERADAVLEVRDIDFPRNCEDPEVPR